MADDEAEASRRRMFDKFQKLFTRHYTEDFGDKTVLDLGSGGTGFIMYWSKMFGRAYACDIYPCGANYADMGIEFVLSDGHRVPLPDGSVDVVVSHSTLEHVLDVREVIADIDRLLKPGGHAFLTVSPLYYSATGLHRKGQGFDNWEHLDPANPSYLASSPFPRKPGEEKNSGSYLNKLTMDQLLGAIGTVPWQIDKMELSILEGPPPPWVEVDRFGLMNVLTKGFRLYVTKLRTLKPA